MFTIQFIRATFWLFSVWTATLTRKHESTENSEVALSAFAFFKLKRIYLETTFCSDLAESIHSLETVTWQNIQNSMTRGHRDCTDVTFAHTQVTHRV